MPRPAQPRPRSRRRLLLAGAPLLAAGAAVSVVLVGSAGRNGVAVTRVFGGERTEWIFSRSSLTYLGGRAYLVKTTSAGPKGMLTATTAVLARRGGQSRRGDTRLPRLPDPRAGPFAPAFRP